MLCSSLDFTGEILNLNVEVVYMYVTYLYELFLLNQSEPNSIFFIRNGQCNEFYLKTNKDPWILSAVKTARSTTLISLLSAIPTVCIIKSRPGWLVAYYLSQSLKKRLNSKTFFHWGMRRWNEAESQVANENENGTSFFEMA